MCAQLVWEALAIMEVVLLAIAVVGSPDDEGAVDVAGGGQRVEDLANPRVHKHDIGLQCPSIGQQQLNDCSLAIKMR